MFLAWLKDKYQEGDKIYDTADEAMRDLAKRGFNIVPVKHLRRSVFKN